MANLFLVLMCFALFGGIVLIAAKLGRAALYVLSASFIVLSNISVAMLVPVFGLELSWAVVIYSMVYLITDFLCEHHGVKEGYRLVWTNLGIQAVVWLYVQTCLAVTPADGHEQLQEHIKALFGASGQVSIAAFVGALGPFLDVYIFDLVRRAWLRGGNANWKEDVHRRAAGLWAVIVRMKVSTVVGHIVNSAVFFGIALVGSGISARTLINVIISASIAKVLVSLIDIPLIVAYERSAKRALSRD